VTVPERPLLVPWCRLVEDGDRLLLERARSVVVLEGGAVRTLLPELLPLLDGSRTREEIDGALGGAARTAVDQALEVLTANALIVEGGAETSRGAAAVAAAYGLGPAEAGRRLREARIALVGESRLGRTVMRLLGRSGIGSVERLGWEPESAFDLAVVAPAPSEAGRLESWNAAALEQGARWVAVRPFDGAATTIGPLVVPGESPCHTCLLLRLGGQLEYGSDFARIERTPLRVEAGAPLETIAAGVAAHLVIDWIGGHDTRLPGLVHVIESGPPLVLSAHPILRVPRCPACSPAERLAPPVPWHEAAAA
jgi:bacteriocin biosynthesis cyclodehydratase domain-containing protein